MKSACNHLINPESTPTRLPRFLDTHEPSMTLEEALNMPLSMDRMPFEVNTLLPTPLDPFSLKVLGGLSYVEAAQEYMIGQLYHNAGELSNTHEDILMHAEHEIDFQHRHRMQKNTEAMDKWRESASTSPSSNALSHREAEGIMQVRAGIAQPNAIIELLARNPEMDGIEIAKATRPLCFNAFMVAKDALYSKLKVLNSRSQLTINLGSEVYPRSYRSNIDPDNQSLTAKAKLGVASMYGVELELITRDSSILYHPDQTPSMPEAVPVSFGPNTVETVPIDTTAYVRIKR